MNNAVKEKWVAALRSGEYRQATGKLRDCSEDAYCCLGVLCELYKVEVGGRWTEFDHGRFTTPGGSSSSVVLPQEVADWAGVDNDPGFEGSAQGTVIRLSGLNDSGRSFEHIADMIETKEVR